MSLSLKIWALRELEKITSSMCRDWKCTLSLWWQRSTVDIFNRKRWPRVTEQGLGFPKSHCVLIARIPVSVLGRLAWWRLSPGVHSQLLSLILGLFLFEPARYVCSSQEEPIGWNCKRSQNGMLILCQLFHVLKYTKENIEILGRDLFVSFPSSPPPPFFFGPCVK